MRQTNTRTVAEQKPLGVIDAISAGLTLVWRRPWTLIVPILFDALIWILPRLSLAQLFRPFQTLLLGALAISADPSNDEVRTKTIQTIDSLNLLGVVSGALNAVTRIPALLSVNASDVTSPFTALAWSTPLESPELAILLFVPLFLLGLLGVAVYLESIAQGVRPLETQPVTAALLRIAKLWLSLIWFSLLIVALLLVASIAIVAVRTIFNSPELAEFFTLLASVGIFWLFIYFFFVPAVMAVSNVGFSEAMRRSTLLFRIFFWTTLALVALSVFLDQGLTLIWSGLTVSALGVILGVVANSFIGTALLAASMVYYQDRMNLFERMRAQIKSKPKPKPKQVSK